MSSRLLTGGECPQGVLDVVEGAIGYLALSVGYTAIEYAALRVLSNLFFSFTEDLAVYSLLNAESAGRTSILLSDIVLGLIDMGFDVSGLNEIPRKRMYRGCKEPVGIGSSSKKGVVCGAVFGPGGTTVIPRPLSLRPNWSGNPRFGVMGPTSSLNMSVGQGSSDQSSCSVPPPAPGHLQLPILPEPHTYLNTRVRRAPIATDPSSLRRRIVEQRRKVQQSLIRFLGRVQPVQYLFPGDAESFMCMPLFNQLHFVFNVIFSNV
ncbi:Transcription initiation factor TFIID subunit 8 isoform 3 [Schistosoma japonicum]|uniref:Transcription initiation factor TFIID subunit 8 n=1 Tax=Schistosoma japonicum TaxID=6182 RepID=A0A4Z2DUB6_SCHJA|nr:Transcription initiation factor TFIID subunit 8 [Schistosoma japonicum]KAH8867189.1 Transcription initiation factor TFIID subunit 8 [Schistosoma japonicum]KAH8867191.1 Transcription initiation factor TFIID subunit 8 [Schistosoma japonicum]TNN20143.1 Transcription initiation factor TFIID subunit 8 isoform 3 [Schistosoma japonicum]